MASVWRLLAFAFFIINISLAAQTYKDGDYLVTAVIGGEKSGETCLRAESRRSYIENYVTKAGQRDTVHFLLHKRSPRIDETRRVAINEWEKTKLDWDDSITFEILGTNPQARIISIEPAPPHRTMFLCGNSTVVNQNEEPWCSWGQIIPRFLGDTICVANHAESGESATSFIASRRWEKVLSLVRPNDYVLIEFGHNDEKFAADIALQQYYNKLKQMVVDTREKGAMPILITPAERRHFNSDGTLRETHGEFPATMRRLAVEMQVSMIDLTSMTRKMYEAWGMEESKKAFVHYPAGTFPNQTAALKDDTHFNAFGAYEVARCVATGLSNIGIGSHSFNSAQPDNTANIKWYPSRSQTITKPEGN